MGVYTHQGGAGNGAAGGNRGVYCPPPEQGRTLHFKSYYHRILSSGGAEASTAPIQEMVGAAYSRYSWDKGGTCSIRREGKERREEKGGKEGEGEVERD